jgi:predicted methyltransferase
MRSSPDTLAAVPVRRFMAPSAWLAGLALLLGACTTAPSGPPTGATLSSERIAAIVASPDRSAADRNNDLRRKPAQMLAFIGVRPGMVALDLSAARGYTTELIARAVGPAGRVYGQNAPRVPAPASPNRARCTASRKRSCARRSRPQGSSSRRKAISCATRPTRATGTRPSRRSPRMSSC